MVNHVTGVVTYPPSMTKQEFVAECDINNVLKQFKQTGMVSHISAKASQGSYENLPDPIDFQESVHLVHAAEAAFATLPSKVRARFDQDPLKFLEFTSDPANREEMITLGLVKAPPKDPEPVPPPEPPPPPPNA